MANVAVIGAGPQGLATLKNLREEHFNATIFDRRPSIGGVWQYTEDEKETSMLPTTLGNISKYRNCFTDFPISEDAPTHMTSQQTLDYLAAYATNFDLNPLIQLNTLVQSVCRTPDDKQWQLQLVHNGEEECREFDKVVFCTGANQNPVLPEIEGKELFMGAVLHSQAFKRPDNFTGQNVIVVGLGSTAADTACELVGRAKRIYLSHRRGNHVFARWCKGKPLDLFGNRRSAYIRDAISSAIPKMSQKLFEDFAEKLADSCFKLEPGWNFKPAPSVLTHKPIISEELVDHLKCGAIISVPGVKRFAGDQHVELEDGSKIEADAVIFCTGYTADYLIKPQFTRAVPAADSSRTTTSFDIPPLPRLYQNIFSLEYPDSVAYLTNWTLGDGIMPNADLASMAITQVWKGTFQLPSQERMNQEIDAHHAWARDVAGDNGTFSEIVQHGPWINWLNNVAGTGVNEYLGYGRQGWLFYLRERSFCNLLMTGVDSPHVLRLFPGRRKPWPGARDAIIRVNKDAERRIKEHARLKP